ncbi:hypothetical protein BDV96DRAFT_649961 [Lophiotrema nucula]|uniref:Isochorismatase-like protein n=1 Tax=Lophiotrema nucula TaxID=690887 RepID=A0A6A5YZ69_9PLEO|nr:hypothetical protein BDV96DRAFT_649961 [Lophiotrema nucula]
MAAPISTSPFYVPVDIRHIALLISDVQTQILARFPKETQDAYLAQIQRSLDFFRYEIAKARSSETGGNGLYEGVPLIVHHTLPFNLNANAFVSPYNKLAKWVKQLEEKGLFATISADPHHPNFAIPSQVIPPRGWESKDEIVLGKLSPSFAHHQTC